MASFIPAMVICGDCELGLTSWVGGRVMPSLWQWSKAVGGDGGHVWRLMCGLGWGHPWDLRHWTTMIEQHLNHTFMVLGNGVGVSYFLVNTDLKLFHFHQNQPKWKENDKKKEIKMKHWAWLDPQRKAKKLFVKEKVSKLGVANWFYRGLNGRFKWGSGGFTGVVIITKASLIFQKMLFSP